MSKREFPQTRWTLIQQAQDVHTTSWRVALSELCEIYWYPVYSQVRFRGYGPQDAEDLTQSFFAALLDRKAFENLSANKGKFRSFLLKALTYYLVNDRRRRATQKRGGDRVILSFDQAQAEARWQEEPFSADDPEKLYELTWARTLIQNSLEALAREYTADAEERELFRALSDRLLDGPSPDATRALATRLGKTEGAIRLAAFRMRRRLARLVKAEILQTVSDPSEVEEEIAYLVRLFSEPASSKRMARGA